MTRDQRRKTPTGHQAVVDGFNRQNPIGTPVTRYRRMNPLRDGVETKTRSEAWLMGGHTAMVMVEGVAGGVAVESVVVIDPISKAVAR